MAETTPVERIQWRGVTVRVKREDRNHPIVQGNKLHKLKYNLMAAKQQKAKTLVTFGGAYSNHLLATAFVAQQAGLNATGVVRGEELKHAEEQWSETLNQCRQLGMRLEFVSRADYRLKQQSEPIQHLLRDLGSYFIIPEGGSNPAAVQGVSEWLESIKEQFKLAPSHLICPVGTGGTLAGIIAGCGKNHWDCQIIGVAVLKGLQSVKYDVNQWLKQSNPGLKRSPDWSITSDYCGAGYARLSADMKQFGARFKTQHGIALDKIYNVKSFFALDNMLKKGLIKSHHRPMIIHTGGLQGGIVS
ncbi:MAG: pyridoxal-phosphate dependent enzyme [Proteobacteria bacterium]|nr:pyridoxal-phosphate dependent enzyme [Pseudomonadota bacterium]